MSASQGTSAYPPPNRGAPRHPRGSAALGRPGRDCLGAGGAGGPWGTAPGADTSALPAAAWVCGSGLLYRVTLSPGLWASRSLCVLDSLSPRLCVSPSLGPAFFRLLLGTPWAGTPQGRKERGTPAAPGSVKLKLTRKPAPGARSQARSGPGLRLLALRPVPTQGGAGRSEKSPSPGHGEGALQAPPRDRCRGRRA